METGEKDGSPQGLNTQSFGENRPIPGYSFQRWRSSKPFYFLGPWGGIPLGAIPYLITIGGVSGFLGFIGGGPYFTGTGCFGGGLSFSTWGFSLRVGGGCIFVSPWILTPRASLPWPKIKAQIRPVNQTRNRFVLLTAAAMMSLLFNIW